MPDTPEPSGVFFPPGQVPLALPETMSLGVTGSSELHELPSLVVEPVAVDGSAPRQVPSIQHIPATPLDPQQLSEALKGFDDVDSDDYTEDPASQSDCGDLIQEAEEAYSQAQIDDLMNELRESGLVKFMHKYIGELAVPPRKLLMAFGVLVDPDYTNEKELYRILKMSINRVLRRRAKLPNYNTVSDAVQLIANARKIMVLSGAGVSTSCGIPDFRSANGIYANLKRIRPELTDPQEMFDIHVFKEDPSLFYSFAKELYPSNFKPSPSHRFVQLLEQRDVLLRNYTQNIDTLERVAGIQKVLNCHGSFAEAMCIVCGHRIPGDGIKDEIFAGTVPLCTMCTQSDAYIQQKAKRKQIDARNAKRRKFSSEWDGDDDGEEDDERNEWEGQPIMKPTITFFGEKLADDFDERLMEDRDQVDLLIVMGTSLKVAPVSEILGHIPHSVPQILINRDPVPHCHFDIALLGDSDTIVQYLCQKLAETTQDDTWRAVGAADIGEPERVGTSHAHLFQGANSTNKWLAVLDPSRRIKSRSSSPRPSMAMPRLGRPKSRSGSKSRSSSPVSDASGDLPRPRGRPRKRSFSELGPGDV